MPSYWTLLLFARSLCPEHPRGSHGPWGRISLPGCITAFHKRPHPNRSRVVIDQDYWTVILTYLKICGTRKSIEGHTLIFLCLKTRFLLNTKKTIQMQNRSQPVFFSMPSAHSRRIRVRVQSFYRLKLWLPISRREQLFWEALRGRVFLQ